MSEIQKKFVQQGFLYNSSHGSMSKRGSHKLDNFIKDSYVKFYDTKTEVYSQINESKNWNHYFFDEKYNLTFEETIDEESLFL